MRSRVDMSYRVPRRAKLVASTAPPLRRCTALLSLTSAPTDSYSHEFCSQESSVNHVPIPLCLNVEDIIGKLDLSMLSSSSSFPTIWLAIGPDGKERVSLPPFLKYLPTGSIPCCAVIGSVGSLRPPQHSMFEAKECILRRDDTQKQAT